MNQDALVEELTDLRRALHQRAELSGCETETADFVFSHLSAYGYRPKRFGNAVVADFAAEKKNPTLAFRADMDALPIRECTDAVFASKNPGVSHACGHDGHMAALLVLAHLARELKPGINLRFLFQPKEERCGGARELIDSGGLKGVDLVFGMHLTPELAEGVAATLDGALFAGTQDFSVEFSGTSAHIAMKESGADALAAAVEFYAGAETLAAKYLPHTRFGLCSLHSGTSHNIVPNTAILEGTFRYFDSTKCEAFFLELENLLCGIRKKRGVEHRFLSVGAYPPLFNTPNLTRDLMKALNLEETHARWTSEDFSEYLTEVPGMYYWLGVGDKYAAALHTSTFNFDESVLMRALEINLGIIRYFENKRKY